MWRGLFGRFETTQSAVANIYEFISWTTRESLHSIETFKEANRTKITCFFRCLAFHNGCHTKNLERDTKHYYQQYRDAGPLSKKRFHGVKLSELDELEKMYEVSIQVYSLAPTQNHSEDEDNE